MGEMDEVANTELCKELKIIWRGIKKDREIRRDKAESYKTYRKD